MNKFLLIIINLSSLLEANVEFFKISQITCMYKQKMVPSQKT